MRKILRKLLLPIAIVLALKLFYGVGYSYLCYDDLDPEFPKIGNEKVESTKDEIFLAPLRDFDKTTAIDLAEALMSDIGVRVGVIENTDEINLERSVVRGQYKDISFYTTLKILSDHFKQPSQSITIIGLTNKHMYPSDKLWFYPFAAGWKDKISIISTYRFHPTTFTDRIEARKAYGRRLYKAAKRAIGEHYFEYKRNSKPDSIMRNPAMSITEIDKLSFSY